MAGGFFTKRLASAELRNDGRRTPMRDHAVLLAQQATATCCRWRPATRGTGLRRAGRRLVCLLRQGLVRRRTPG